MSVAAVRVDKWLWAARFFKTRALASEAVKGGHVEVNGIRCKASKMLQLGDQLNVLRGVEHYHVTVVALGEKRGSATLAQSLYEESQESIQAREKMQQQRKDMAPLGPEKRPDKKSRRHIIRFQRQL